MLLPVVKEIIIYGCFYFWGTSSHFGKDLKTKQHNTCVEKDLK
jgi:hypothetical protein